MATEAVRGRVPTWRVRSTAVVLLRVSPSVLMAGDVTVRLTKSFSET